MSASGVSRLSSTHRRMLLHVWSVSNVCVVSLKHVCSVLSLYGQCWAYVVSLELVWSVSSMCGLS